MEQFRVAIVYGKSVKHQPQRVGLSHELADEDISKYTFCYTFHYFSLADLYSYYYQAVEEIHTPGTTTRCCQKRR